MLSEVVFDLSGDADTPTSDDDNHSDNVAENEDATKSNTLRVLCRYVDGREVVFVGEAGRTGSAASGRTGDSLERGGDGERGASCTFPGSASGELVVGVNALAPPNRSDAPEDLRRGIRS